MEHKIVKIEVRQHRDTKLLIAMSDDLKGLYVHARTEEEMDERLPIAIRAILEAKGMQIEDVVEVGSHGRAEAFAPMLREFGAKVAA